MAKNIECKCESNFTCGYCLRNAKPWHFTCSNGAVIPAAPVDSGRHGYNAQAVEKAIASSNRSGRKIGAAEAKAIHRLLKGR